MKITSSQQYVLARIGEVRWTSSQFYNGQALESIWLMDGVDISGIVKQLLKLKLVKYVFVPDGSGLELSAHFLERILGSKEYDH